MIYYFKFNDKNDLVMQWYDSSLRKKMDIWYRHGDIIDVGLNGYGKSQNNGKQEIPKEIVDCLKEIADLLEPEKDNFKPGYPVKLSEILFIYRDDVYRITGGNVGIIYGDPRLDIYDETFFEEYNHWIREYLKDKLHIKYTYYNGFLD